MSAIFRGVVKQENNIPDHRPSLVEDGGSGRVEKACQLQEKMEQ